ncbi:dihydrodipicolinate synthase family protein [Alsobacter metallidurans]|uniref:Dihydrodipicolinate synthase family protein n=1 Tax=Alsobacter metallidurans TaxID=340221 RepID=A0A917I525_9HYPH|nr:dihydrodipicolinate synthase family protein [Alsobacter metallidurans]GGH13515.1 dihydrodipicolinate synthase family protein [Alsobacter metallidurans]
MQPTQQRFGLSVALSTPFGADARVDLGRIATHANWVLQNGAGSVTLCGTTGEGASIGLTQRAAMLGALQGAGIGADKILIGVASASLDEAAAQARMALDAGCKGLLVAPAFYFKGVSDDGVFSWFSKFFERTPGVRDVFLYHIPSVTAVGLSAELIGRLRKAFPAVIAGVKDSSGDAANTAGLLEQHGDLAILVGDERQLAGAVRKGAQGTICGCANFIPDILAPVANEGRDDPRVKQVVDLVCQYPVMSAVKALIAHRTNDPAWLNVCPPLEPLTAQQARDLTSGFDRIVGAKAA